MSDIIPFGKYKGQDINEIRQRDPAYLQWLTQQAWFAEKFAPVYQLVVNNFAPPSEDTPAHNAMQVRFLEFAYRSAFVETCKLDINWDWLRQEQLRYTANLRRAPLACAQRKHASDWARHIVKLHRDQVRQHWQTWRLAHKPAQQWFSIGDPKFEAASDVEFSVVAKVGRKEQQIKHLNGEWCCRLAIELKPSMGDDYPAVLRQIKRQQTAAIHADPRPTHWYLLLDEFGSTAITLDQVRLIFAHNGIDIVLVSEVREKLMERQHG
jgi:hypothetical protein